MLTYESGVPSFDQHRCCQCGACLAVCKAGALAREWRQNGLFEVTIDRDRCGRCRQCVRVCPAPRLSARRATEHDWEKVQEVLLGCSVDSGVRYNASSGGVAREIITTSLEKSLCDMAYCVVETKEYPWAAGAFLTKETARSATIARSQYLPVPVCEGFERVPPGTKILLVGTNCQLLAAKEFFGRDSGVELFTIGILCKQQKTYEFSSFLLNQLKGQPERRERVDYRGEGWPGEVRSGTFSMPYEQAAALPFGKRLWCVPGCHYCGNPLGDSADLTLADPWSIVSDAGGGQTMILVRTEIGRALVQKCSTRLELSTITVELAKHSVRWSELLSKQRQIDARLGYAGIVSRLLLRLGDRQRRAYEWALLKWHWPRIVLRVLNRLPYLG